MQSEGVACIPSNRLKSRTQTDIRRLLFSCIGSAAADDDWPTTPDSHRESHLHSGAFGMQTKGLLLAAAFSALSTAISPARGHNVAGMQTALPPGHLASQAAYSVVWVTEQDRTASGAVCAGAAVAAYAGVSAEPAHAMLDIAQNTTVMIALCMFVSLVGRPFFSARVLTSCGAWATNRRTTLSIAASGAELRPSRQNLRCGASRILISV
jgi:hypothetical protein